MSSTRTEQRKSWNRSISFEQRTHRPRAFRLGLPFLLLALLAIPGESPALSWPLDGNQNTTPIANVYGQYNDFGGNQYTHPGTDFKANAGTKVFAGADGTISTIRVSPPAADYDQGVMVKTDPANTWAWSYWHLDPKAGLKVGDTVTPTSELGTVHNYAPLPAWNHLHLGYTDANNPASGQQNPLRHITYTDTKKPTIPNQTATPDKDAFLYYPNQTENVYYETVIPKTNLGVAGKDQTLVGLRAPTAGNPGAANKSEIDVAVSAYDEIDGSSYRLGLYRMGYWIDGFNYLPDSADVEKHVTFRFWDVAPNQSNGIKNLLYKDDAKANSAGDWTSGETTGQGTFWHIVTNTTDKSNEGDPNSSGLNADAAWKTVAGAAHNAQAKSPDGEYNVVSFAHDLKGNADSDFSRVRLDNFEQLAGVRSTLTPEFMAGPSYKLPEESAAISPYDIELGEDIYTRAVEELADKIITAYLFNHRDWWGEGDELTGYLASTTLLTDSIGETDWGYIWTADRLGVFDIIFDYDFDEVFSYTLDPLIGFRVVPEPGSILLFAMGFAGVIYLRFFANKRAR